MSEITVKDFEDIAKQILDKKRESDDLKSKKAVVDEELDQLYTKAQAMLETSEKDKYVSEFGTMYLSYFSSVSVPKDLEAKKEFFQYLKDQNIYDEVVTVNAQWLNGYYRREEEAAKEKEEVFLGIPGVGMAKTTPRLGFRKG